MSRMDPERWTTSEQAEGSPQARAAALLHRVPPPLPLSQAALDRMYDQVHQRLAAPTGLRWRVPRFSLALVIAFIAPLSYAAIRSPSVKAWIHSLPALWHAAPAAQVPARPEPTLPTGPARVIVMEMPAVDLSQPDPQDEPPPERPRSASRAKASVAARASPSPKLNVPAPAEGRAAEDATTDVLPEESLPAARAGADETAEPPPVSGPKLCPEPPFHGDHWSKDEPDDPPTVGGKLVPCSSIPRARTQSWDCEKPFAYFGSGDVHLRVAVDNRAQARRIEIIDSTDSALAEATRSCAMRQAYETGRDATGNRVGGYTESIHVHYQ